MQHSTLFRGIDFQLDMQSGTRYVLFVETTFLLQMTKYYFYYVHVQLQSYEDTDNKITLT